ncbi:YceK/YidQ family lipoprotein [Aquirhabdus parva]|uniref:YceK/YidQ family lipoprotein n=2 Tax=Aquirhabdus parva TaxID=2283318 RepID=A0A345P6L3_9GAMM|nr:YceK/YidQ family lipoprotein [Aquirhabdus parva]
MVSYFHMLKRILLLTLITVVIQGCGSFSTLGRDQYAVRADLNRHKTKCTSIPQIYSGVVYDACRANNNKNNPGSDLYGGAEFSFFSFDLVPSFIIDTFALPYTSYQQYKLGSISIEKE